MNALFRKRIGLSESEHIKFESLAMVLEKTAKTIPFENLAVIENRTNNITKENLVKKILIDKEGGLCYDLNLIVYFFLVENGFNALLTEAIIYNNDTQEYRGLGGMHLIILLTHKEEGYLIDAGFGGNVPLKPLPLSGDVVASANGEFRVKKMKSKHGDYVFEMKLKHRDKEWKIGYAIDSKDLIKDISILDDTQRFITEHNQSPFNKGPFITRLTPGGYLTLTENTFTQHKDGVILKEEIDKPRFKELLKEHFGL